MPTFKRITQSTAAYTVQIQVEKRAGESFVHGWAEQVGVDFRLGKGTYLWGYHQEH